MKIPLTGGAYQAEGNIANAQVCENLYPEVNPNDNQPAQPVTHYPRPGLRLLWTPPLPEPGIGVLGRGVFAAKNGDLYCVVGPRVFYIDPAFTENQIGQIADGSSPISMANNTQNIVLVDGSTLGYTINLATRAFALLVDASGLFIGATRADYMDTFLTFNAPGSNEWYISLPDQITFNILNQANKSSYPDNIITQAANMRNVWLLGYETSEVWFLSGAADFPFEEWPNTFIPYGCAASGSICRADVNLFWLARNKDGKCLMVRSEGYAVVAVSNRGLEYEWNLYPDVSDAISYTYQQSGHTFVVIAFPSANKAWGYDLATKQWHRRTWLDENGEKNRERVSFAAFAYGMNIGQDWETGQLYELSPTTYQDNGGPIAFVRSFPHVVDDMNELSGASFVLDFEATNLDENANPQPSVSVRLSKDGGYSYGNARERPLVSGKPRNIMRWRGWGMGRDLVYEASWSFNGRGVLQGAFFDPEAADA